MKPRIQALVAVLIAASAMFLFSGPASAGASCTGTFANAPDGRIKVDGNAFVGAGEYPFSFTGRILAEGEQAVFVLKWKNVGVTTRTIRVVRFGNSSQDPGYSVKYFLNGVNVSSTVKQGGQLVFAGIAPNKSTPALQLVVKNKGIIGLADVAQYLGGRYGGTAPLQCDRLAGFIN